MSVCVYTHKERSRKLLGVSSPSIMWVLRIEHRLSVVMLGSRQPLSVCLTLSDTDLLLFKLYITILAVLEFAL